MSMHTIGRIAAVIGLSVTLAAVTLAGTASAATDVAPDVKLGDLPVQGSCPSSSWYVHVSCFNVINLTGSSLNYRDEGINLGEWQPADPPQLIPDRTKAMFEAHDTNNGWGVGEGVRGYFRYWIGDTGRDFMVQFDNRGSDTGPAPSYTFQSVDPQVHYRWVNTGGVVSNPLLLIWKGQYEPHITP
ncbi:hypothetical protein [Nocardia terpenica]|uniref:Uncharacterized protein n=1 Tax=Nocardia terpenica TaxID=455432 RepID=A0A291RPJ0_9NOCA|nr:hypothetical protein [Nocardia terpenica]ATL69189.1 hypothetical protein CRH09_26425 [Nocardia terpenica]